MMKLNIQLFASTNKTANYDLPQFVGTDKPTWLGDFNTAMSAIDTGMAENASDIATMASDVATATSTASQASQAVSSLTSTVNTLSTNVQSATTTANNASSTASSALNTANTANGKADTNASAISSLQTSVTALTPVELFTNASGASPANVTLSDSVSNYSQIEIVFVRDGGGHQTSVVRSESYSNFDLHDIFYSSNILRIYTYNMSVSGTSITQNTGRYANIANNGSVNCDADNNLKIYEVVGYK